LPARGAPVDAVSLLLLIPCATIRAMTAQAFPKVLSVAPMMDCNDNQKYLINISGLWLSKIPWCKNDSIFS
jgi:hypothetical protein